MHLWVLGTREHGSWIPVRLWRVAWFLLGSYPDTLASFLPAQPGPGLSWAPLYITFMPGAWVPKHPPLAPDCPRGATVGPGWCCRLGVRSQRPRQSRERSRVPFPHCPSVLPAPLSLLPSHHVQVCGFIGGPEKGPVSQKHCSTFPARLLQAFPEGDNLNF